MSGVGGEFSGLGDEMSAPQSLEPKSDPESEQQWTPPEIFPAPYLSLPIVDADEKDLTIEQYESALRNLEKEERTIIARYLFENQATEEVFFAIERGPKAFFNLDAWPRDIEDAQRLYNSCLQHRAIKHTVLQIETKIARIKENALKENKEEERLVNTIRFLSYRANVQMSQYFGWRHFLFHFFPLQVLVTLAAILAFVAASDVNKRPSTAVVLALIAGIIGFVVTFITTMERYCNWKSNADVDKSTAMVYSKMKQDIDSVIARITSGDDVDAREMVLKFEEKMKNIEELSGEHLIPTQIRMAFHHLELKIKQTVSGLTVVDTEDRKILKGDQEDQAREYSQFAFAMVVEYITTYRNCCCVGWPFVLPNADVVAEKVYEKVFPEVVLQEHPKLKKEVQLLKSQLKKAQQKNETPPSPTSPVDANAPPFAEDMA